MAVDHILALAVRADEAAAVDLDLAALANDAELDRVPEEAAELFKHRRIVRCDAQTRP